MSVAGAKGHDSERKESCWSKMSRLAIRVVSQWSACTLHVQGPAWQEGREGDRERGSRLGTLQGRELKDDQMFPPPLPQRRRHRSLGPAAPADPGQTLPVRAIPG